MRVYGRERERESAREKRNGTQTVQSIGSELCVVVYDYSRKVRQDREHVAHPQPFGKAILRNLR